MSYHPENLKGERKERDFGTPLLFEPGEGWCMVLVSSRLVLSSLGLLPNPSDRISRKTSSRLSV